MIAERTVIRQLQTVKEKLIPFWGHGRTTMEFAPDSSGNFVGKFIYRIPDGESYMCKFQTTSDMAAAAASPEIGVQNLLLAYIADTFREFMLSLPREIRMEGPGTQYPTNEELEEIRIANENRLNSERQRCLRIARHAGHLAKIGAIKFSFGSGEVPTPMEAARLQAEYIATSIEFGGDPGVCDCEEKSQ